MAMSKRRNATSRWYLLPYKIAGIYLVIGTLWIVLSHTILREISGNLALFLYFGILGEWFFVFLSGLAIFFLSQRETKKWEEAEAKIQESERFLSTLISNLPGLVYRCANDRNWTMKYLSEGCLSLTGYNPQDLIENRTISFNQIIHPDDREKVWESIQSAIKELRPYKLEYRIRTAYGGEKWVWEQSRGIFDKKGNLQMLEGFIMDITEKKKAEQQLSYTATHDPLTGLPNRLLFTDRLKQELARASRSNTIAAVMMLDLDHFKEVNDTFGHTVGDVLLKSAARRLEDCIRLTDTVARMGGDEFIFIFSDIKRLQEVEKLLNRIFESFSEPFSIDIHQVSITPSIGVSLYPFDGETAEVLIKNADIAMYRAKDAGRNNYQFFSQASSKKLTDKETKGLSGED